mgnify:CR=1 FL=1
MKGEVQTHCPRSLRLQQRNNCGGQAFLDSFCTPRSRRWTDLAEKSATAETRTKPHQKYVRNSAAMRRVPLDPADISRPWWTLSVLVNADIPSEKSSQPTSSPPEGAETPKLR